ncbi:MAG: N-acetyl-alpha-D-glucosaminyl L-malate synthase BshA [bacterium]|nr:N-acetyl-alpha-D-glucosaminyl L-malate synthase BshA [bacterium]
MKRPLRIGMVCYPTAGGSGVVAAELGKHLAHSTSCAPCGHIVHFIGYDIPLRLRNDDGRIFFHQVEIREYPLFDYPPYTVALASKMVEVCNRFNLDILHVHYAVPHATSACLAREIIGNEKIKIITSLHGTDITLVGRDPSYKPITHFSIMKSDAIITPSEYLKEQTCDFLDIPCTKRISVIPNFVDSATFNPGNKAQAREHIEHFLGIKLPEVVICHASNFRPLKRVTDAVRAFHQACSSDNACLLMIGDGPDRPAAESLARTLGIQNKVIFPGQATDMVPLLQASDIFLFPSENESFGLAALEAMACAIPVVAYRVGGVPEVVEDGVSGFLAPLRDLPMLTKYLATLTGNSSLRTTMGEAARLRATENFSARETVARYEQLYHEVLA